MSVVDVTILEKLYRNSGAEESLRTQVQNVISEFDAELEEIRKNFRAWAVLRIRGPEVEEAVEEIVEEFDTVRSLFDVSPGDIIYGRIVDLYRVGYGVYVDIGVVGPEVVDALVPLYRLREQLLDGEKASIRDIGRSFGFVENMPLEVEIVEVNEERGEIEAKLTDEQVEYLLEMAADHYDRMIVAGVTRKRLQRILNRAGFGRRVIRIERWGLLESEVVFDEGVDAPGVLAKVGPYLRGCEVELIYDDKFLERIGFIPSPEGPILE
ncbi:DUF2110 family protein [Methanopyrus sp. KOL6]|uniref:DUF2110 family protein n=1 Tax=Methanopyrus sp. KOL6 TaxID=1937004 RepID=UPI000B4AB387|nr:DUF2110 family protein [Methanopyrus sp. KOL6]